MSNSIFDGAGLNINECLSVPCLNDGTCYDLVNGTFCACVMGYAGPLCATAISPSCSQDHCKNGGTSLRETSHGHASKGFYPSRNLFWGGGVRRRA